MKSEIIKEIHLKALADFVDGSLSAHGFIRPKRANKYKRSCADGVQEIKVFYTMPRYSDDDSIAHVSPHVHIIFPKVIEVYNEANKHMPDFRKSDCLFNQNAGLVLHKPAYIEWKPVSEEDYKRVGREMATFLTAHTVPFLDDFLTTASLVSAHEARDPRLFWNNNRDWIITVACAAYSLGRRDVAWKIIEEALCALPGPAKTFKSVIDFFRLP